PSWNDVREQRVLGRIVEGRKQRGSRARGLALAAASLCASGGVVAWQELHRPAVAVVPESHASEVTLADGSEAILGAGGKVEIEEQEPARVALRQRAGSARYVVKPDPSREFEV